MCVLDEGDNSHLRFAFRALQGVNLIYALYAGGPTTFAGLLPIVALVFFRRRRGELGSFPPSPTGVPCIVYIIDEYGVASTTRSQFILDEVVVQLMTGGTLVIIATQRDEDIARLMELIQERGLTAEVEIVSVGEHHSITTGEIADAIANRPFEIAREQGIPDEILSRAMARAKKSAEAQV